MTMTAGARGTDSIAFTLPSGAIPICAVPAESPNAAFVMVGPYSLTDSGVAFGYHNEATIAITGTMAFIILYQIGN